MAKLYMGPMGIPVRAGDTSGKGETVELGTQDCVGSKRLIKSRRFKRISMYLLTLLGG